ncbi:PREDICTED: uncharacterized protein LOC108367564 [Rhagoletis zephyria]|uniref:uncharacterized protein LOC108367564 n=1 Tax=Rhagoletis zephyria TaxID=28612 RepID=UPI0008116A2B|nr:PREDICTED: uncharacterized protein LOC108367564 [Rhagoletis zephyria]
MLYFIRRNICLLFAKQCRRIYCILFSPNVESWTWTRHICSCFIGICITTILWWLLLLNLNFSVTTDIAVLIAFLILIGIGFILNSSIKCITFLILAGMAGKSGRSYLRALVFAYIISGPISNLVANSGEVVRVFACATTLAYNLTKTRLDLMTKPFQNTLITMKDDVTDVENSFEKMIKILEPIWAEVEEADFDSIHLLSRREDKSMGDYVQKAYSKKFEVRCKRQLNRGKQRCFEAFAKARLECENEFPRIVRFLLCWPFQVDFICRMNLLGNPKELCNPSQVLPKNFGESYAQLDDTHRQLHKNGSRIEVKYKIKSAISEPAQR